MLRMSRLLTRLPPVLPCDVVVEQSCDFRISSLSVRTATALATSPAA